MAEMKRDETISNTGLSTAALARADETAEESVQQGYVEQRDVEQREAVRDRRGSVEDHLKGGAGQSTETDAQSALFSPDESKELHATWDAIQVGFVDEPRQAVEKADSLVAGAMKRLAEIFAEERARLEGQWDRGDSVSTEELRLALRRYRAFFGRLLSV
jgi:hypothetical protein